MAHNVLDFQWKRVGSEAECAEYDARHKRIVAIFEMWHLLSLARRSWAPTIRSSLARSGRLLRNRKLPGPGPPDAAS